MASQPRTPVKPSVLVLSAIESVRVAMKTQLGRGACHVITAHDGMSAVDLLPPGRVAAIIAVMSPTDMPMLVALARLRELPQCKDSGLIVVTDVGPGASRRLEQLVAPLRLSVMLHRPVKLSALEAAIQAHTRPPPSPGSRATTALRVALDKARAARDPWQRLEVPRDAPTHAVRKMFLQRMAIFSPGSVGAGTPAERAMLKELHTLLRQAFDAIMESGNRTSTSPAPAAASAQTSRRSRPKEAVKAPQPSETGEHAFDEAPTDRRKTWQLLMDSARLKAVMEDYVGAISLAERALQERPDLQDIRYRLALYRGLRAKSAGAMTSARAQFRLAVKLAPPGSTTAQDELESL